MRRSLKYLYVLLSLGFFGCNQLASQDGVFNVTAEKFKHLTSHKSVLVVDVRTPEEFEEGHIPNAINIDFLSKDFKPTIEKLDNKQPVYIYCRSGRRSSKSTVDFKKAGFSEIYNLQGGIQEWKSLKFPIKHLE
ncbi:rhodanese-like domain-containing protein [Tamlana fucoidanivorans]|uniref:Rhodanese-like domain-containing protein n=1 Tax=Allotamlana fucoidanivorans TaxID=2583814 RepID=A0A5C4SKK9_9FLAO|nr:rhodanese-like domain-containing protein [Tamlana fucoidanivorans]TNJ44528.1 rhodanese-like domain-containing protein [Tamlana fucoidanivorans]